MSPEIYDWEATLHKLVTSSEGDLVGNVDAVDDTNILVSTEGARTHYRIPKHIVEGFDGHSVSLKGSEAGTGKIQRRSRRGIW